ncbi:sigma-54 dependent transcriptional regulator [Litorivicinus sp.]|nr:sigma-54 dependent transcriptional regulator [Litorivicinus sp.]
MALEMIIGKSREVSELRGLIRQAAKSDASVLILGESGTGKELVAKALHAGSARSAKQFVPVNCGAIPSELLESELFGHKKGAFTGAISDRVGRFELASKGTLFLDEIGDMPLEMQVKLLRVLQERSVDPVGSSRSVAIDVRVVAATHRNLEMHIEKGMFREDLFYRLNVIPIVLPSLRERKQDIPELINHFINQHRVEHGRPTFDADLFEALCEYEWPGNIRELLNLVHRLCCFFPNQKIALSKIPASLLPGPIAPYGARHSSAFIDGAPQQSELDLSLFEPEAANPVEDVIMRAQSSNPGSDNNLPESGLNLKDHLADIEKNLIIKALQESDGNVSQTARLLNLQRTTLIEKINKYKLA